MTTAGRRVCVTGATGKAGRAAVRELTEHGYDVVATDAVVDPGESRGAVLRADLTDRARDLLGYEPAHSWRDYVK